MSEAPIRLAILGADPTTLTLAKYVSARADVQVTHVCDLQSSLDPQVAELQRALVRDAELLKDWEVLLNPGLVDGVLVARGNDDEHRSDQLRKFAQIAVPVLISHPVVNDMLLLYELDMIRRDSRAVIVPVMTDRLHPAIAKIRRWIELPQDSPVGAVEQITIDRQLADRGKSSVIHRFACDVDLLRALCGELNQVGAMGTAGEENAYGNLSVQLTGPGKLLARWAVGPRSEPDADTGRLLLTGNQGQVSLTLPPQLIGARLTTGGEDDEPSSSWDPNEQALDLFRRALHGEQLVPDLLDAARAMELAGTIGRSLTRRRTIDLYFEEHSEENTFKSKMAAGGCLLLMLGLVALPILAILAKAGVPGVGLWAWIMAGAFGLFVLLQLLTFAFRK